MEAKNEPDMVVQKGRLSGAFRKKYDSAQNFSSDLAQSDNLD